MTVTLASLRARFPEFVSTADGLLTIALEDAEAQVGDWGSDRDRAVSYLAAHYLAERGEGDAIAQANATAQVDTVKVGDVMTKFKDSSASSSSHAWASTLYGRRFFELFRIYSFGAVVV